MKKIISTFSVTSLILILWLLIGVTAILFVPVRPEGTFQFLGDLHYLGVAWNMFKSHSWLLTYSAADLQKVDLEKTPMLYWCILSFWHLLGVNTASAKTVIFLIGSACLGMTYLLARELFPENKQVAILSLVLLLANFMWPNYFSASIRFEGLITFFGLGFLICFIKFIRTEAVAWLGLAGFSLGLCIFAKGGVGFIYFLPLGLMIPFIFKKPIYLPWITVFLSIFVLALIPSAIYLVFIYFSLGPSDLEYLLFKQVTNRVGLQFHFKTVLGFLLCFSPAILLFHWQRPKLDKRMGILLLQIVFVLVFFTFFVDIQTKRYFIPCCPLIALVLAALIVQTPVKNNRICAFLIFFGLLFSLVNVIDHFGPSAKYYRNLSLLAAEISSLQLQGENVAQFTPNIANQNLDYLGRLSKSLEVIVDPGEQAQWLREHPSGYIIADCENSAKKSRHCLQIKHQSQIISAWND